MQLVLETGLALATVVASIRGVFDAGQSHPARRRRRSPVLSRRDRRRRRRSPGWTWSCLPRTGGADACRTASRRHDPSGAASPALRLWRKRLRPRTPPLRRAAAPRPRRLLPAGAIWLSPQRTALSRRRLRRQARLSPAPALLRRRSLRARGLWWVARRRLRRLRASGLRHGCGRRALRTALQSPDRRLLLKGEARRHRREGCDAFVAV